MKRIILSLFLFAYLCGAADKPLAATDLQARYTKGLIDFVNAKLADESLEAQYKAEKQKGAANLTKAATTIQEILQAKDKECAAMKPPQVRDEKALNESGVLSCAPIPPKEPVK